ncbi:MAG: NAD(P)H-dependent oxidoreductase [Syntrophaceae bacterium]|nr:NAD(P)H-dependent oxidoreductase [Syntrophaceae bacterium]
MNRVLILFAHPRFEKSRANRALLEEVGSLTHIRLHDLYEEYPDFNVDVEREKALLLDHPIIIWQHPIYMYGAPPLLKQWIDLVLEYGWAHGKEGNRLRGKKILNALTAGGTRDVYARGGHNGYPLREFLAPFEQTARLCKMIYLPPFVVHGTYLLTDGQMKAYGQLYRALLERLTREECNLDTLRQYEYLNDWLVAQNGWVVQ